MEEGKHFTAERMCYIATHTNGPENEWEYVSKKIIHEAKRGGTTINFPSMYTENLDKLRRRHFKIEYPEEGIRVSWYDEAE